MTLIILAFLLEFISLVSGQCVSQSQPNPIASDYPGIPSGTINATIFVLPIPYDFARDIIPAQWNILDGYKTMLGPDFPSSFYPMVVENTIDHGVQAEGYQIPDFSSVRVTFPFVDFLEDGYTNFRWSPLIFLSSDSTIAIEGAEAYGEDVVPSRFEPECDPYAYVKHGDPNRASEMYFKAYPVDDAAPIIDVLFKDVAGEGPYPLSFFVNVTNQPMVANGTTCDNMIRFFNTSITEGQYAPVAVIGQVSVLATTYFSESITWPEASGIRLDTAFIENNYVNCQSLQGYGG